MYSSETSIGWKKFCDFMEICRYCDERCSTCVYNENIKKSYYKPIEEPGAGDKTWRIENVSVLSYAVRWYC